MPVSTRRAYGVAYYALEVDGSPVRFAHVKSVDGGEVKMNSVDEQVGSDNVRIKHATTLETQPINCEIGLSQANFMLWWIKKTWQKKPARHNGSITRADFDMRAQFVTEFFDTLIEETAFPTLDAGSKEAGYLKVKLRPERTTMARGGGEKISGTSDAAKAKLWSPAAFRLVIDGVNVARVNKIDGFTVKQGIKPVAPGPTRFSQLEPTKIDFPDLSCHMPLQFSDEVLDWYNKFVIDGEKDPSAERNGAIEFLSPDRAEVIFRITLYDVGIKSFTVSKAEAGKNEVQKCKFDLYVGSMELENDGALGLE
jgi:hypothetical protein